METEEWLNKEVLTGGGLENARFTGGKSSGLVTID